MDDEEEKYICPHHHLDIHTAECLCRHENIVRNIESGRPPGHIHRTDSDVEELSRRFTNLTPSTNNSEPAEPPPLDYEAVTDCTQNGFHSTAGVASNSGIDGVGDRPNRKESLIAAMASPILTSVPSASPEEEEEEEEEVVWLRREEVNQEPLLKKSKSSLSSSSSSTFHSNKQKHNKQFKPIQQHYKNHSFDEILPADDHHHITEVASSPGLSKMPRRGILKRGGGNRRGRSKAKCDQFARIVAKSCRREQSLALRKEIVVEWQTIATVIDRLLFWIFLLATVVAYLVILIFVPMTKPDFPNDMPAIHAFVRNTPPHS